MINAHELVEVTIRKLVEGGQGLGELPDGKKVFVWNALPGETLGVRVFKQKHSYAEGIAEQIVRPSSERAKPRDAHYISTSPWQMMTFAAENSYKKRIVQDIFAQAKVTLPRFVLSAASGKATPVRDSEAEFTSAGAMENPLGVFHYRNKTEYGFWGDEAGLHLASYQRGSHGKQIVKGSALNMAGIDEAANAICMQLAKLLIRAGDLKTIIVRSGQNHALVASLYVKREDVPRLTLPSELQGLRVYFSNPKSPASVRTKLLQELGSVLLHDALLGKDFVYDVDAFFQVNLPVYEEALRRIKQHVNASDMVDLYAGVGSIGLTVASQSVQLVEVDDATAVMAVQNAQNSGLDASVIEAPAEKSLGYITGDKPVIVDPPRAGLHDRVVAQILDSLPPQIIYLSCNPVTQARDLAKLQARYEIAYFEAFNFFPRTPHIETLAILKRR